MAIAGLLAACNQFPPLGQDDSKSPDVFEHVRSLDLLPRFPRQVDSSGPAQRDRAQPKVYRGEEITEIAPANAQPTQGGDGFELNFENTPVATVAKVVLGDILGVGYSIDPRIQGTVTLASVRPVPKSDILYVLENSLRQSGVVLVRDGMGYRLIPLGDAVGSGNIDSKVARAEPGYGVSVVPLQYVSAQTLIKLLDSFATKPGTVRADPGRNILLIQGSGADRQAAIDMALSFDVDWMRGQSVGIYPVKYSNPDPIIAELEKILDTGENGLSQNIVKFQPIARLNAILVVTKKPSLLRAAENWIKRLDDADTSRAGVHVYRVKYGEARNIALVLNNIFVGGGGSALDAASSQIAPGSGLTSTSSAADRLSVFGNRPPGGGLGSSGGLGSGGTLGGSNVGLGGSSSGGLGGSQSTLGTAGNAAAGGALAGRSGALGGVGGGAGGQPILEGVRITPDVVNNTLLIYASQENYRIIEQTLQQIDRPQLQVAIDATVAEVTLNDNLSYGVQFFLTSHDLGMRPDKGSALNTTATAPPGSAAATGAAVGAAAGAAANAFLSRSFPGFNFLIGPEAQPSMILDALHAVTDVKVLSNPSVVVIDNQVATLQVGDQVPISTGSANVLTAQNTVVNTIDYRSTGIILRVVPRINANGNVRLEIEQEISNPAGTTGSTLTPTISERKVKSSIAVASGQTVLLAGLIKETEEGDRGGIPILDQIPGVREAFTHTTKSRSRTELIIFIRPQIIRDGVDAHFVAEELRSKLRGTIGASIQSEGPLPGVR